jgi:Uma2 family endonuclease
MAMLVLDRDFERRVIARRRRLGIDRFDEVWEGVYVMAPLADDVHQEIATLLAATLALQADLPQGTKVRAGVNVSDRVADWKTNFRCPDVVVFLPGTAAVNHDAFWHGGPDFAVEVRSRGDRARKKLPFYAKVGTREVLLVERKPWSLELFRLRDGQLASVGRSTLDAPAALPSTVLPLAFRLVGGAERPRIELAHADGRTWII